VRKMNEPKFDRRPRLTTLSRPYGLQPPHVRTGRRPAKDMTADVMPSSGNAAARMAVATHTGRPVWAI